MAIDDTNFLYPIHEKNNPALIPPNIRHFPKKVRFLISRSTTFVYFSSACTRISVDEVIASICQILVFDLQNLVKLSLLFCGIPIDPRVTPIETKQKQKINSILPTCFTFINDAEG